MSNKTIRVINFNENEINKNWSGYQKNKLNENIFEFGTVDGQLILLTEDFHDNIDSLDLFTDVFKSQRRPSDVVTLKKQLRTRKENTRKHGYLINGTTFDSHDEYNSLINSKEVVPESKFYFIGCTFNFSEPLKFNHSNEIEWFKWFDCKFSKIDLSNTQSVEYHLLMTKPFFKCNIDNLKFSTKTGDGHFNLVDNDVDNIITNISTVSMEKVEFKLFRHTKLSNQCNFSFESVKIIFDESLLSGIDEKDEKGYLNSYKMLLSNNGLFSQKYTIEKYINYFSSRENRFYKTLFWFNGGYKEYRNPLIGVLVSLLIMSCILYYNQDIFHDKKEVSLVPVFYPIDMFKKIILYSFTLEYIRIKIILILTEVFYIYSVFSVITFIKRKFGFKKEL